MTFREKFISFNKNYYEPIQNIILTLTLFAAVFIGFKQNSINARLTKLNDFVAIVALPGPGDVIRLVNTGKINVYIYGFKNNLSATTTYFVRPRLITAGTLESSYIWIYTNKIIPPTDQNGQFSFSAFLEDEYGKRYIAEFGGEIESKSADSESILTTWSYKTYQWNWETTSPVLKSMWDDSKKPLFFKSENPSK